MAQLSSPGVSVTVVDESFYTPAAPGTVPLIIVASQENKQNASGTGTALGTLKANAGKAYLITSQMELGSTFGIPFFQTDASNNPVHAGEVNEYGLQAAYSFLGVSNRAYVVRADLDTKQLLATANAPTGEPVDGTLWFEASNTGFGVFEWNSASATTTSGQTFTNESVTVITDVAQCVGGMAGAAPLASIGQLGDYAIVATSTLNKLWMKKYLTDTAAGVWVEVGTAAWKKSWPAATGTIASPTLTSTGISFSGIVSSGNGATVGSVLTVTTAITGGSLLDGSELAGSNIPAGTDVRSVNTATLSATTSITAPTITASSSISAPTVLASTSITTPTITTTNAFVTNITSTSITNSSNISTNTLTVQNPA
jgi:hypothetical protein